MRKPVFILPLVTALIGFSAGWLLKPAPSAAPVLTQIQPPRPAPAPTPEKLSDIPAESSPSRPPQPREVRPEVTPPPDESVKSRDDAKLARLAEALNLNDEQKNALLQAMTAAEGVLNPETTLDPSKMLETAVAAGTGIEKALAAILTPEQAAAFEDLRRRANDNSIENIAQSRLSSVAKLTDLSPEQREQILATLRSDVRTSHEARPAGIDLVLDTSVLPTGSTFVAESSVDFLLHSDPSGDPNQIHASFREKQRASLDAQLDLYKSILTPAQYARMKLEVDERKAALDRITELTR